MAENGADASTPTAGTPAEAPESRTARNWVVPALTFIVGLGIGALIFALAGDDAGGEAAPPATASPTPTPVPDIAEPTTPGSDATIVIPAACITTAERAEDATTLIGQAVEAVTELDAAQLQDIVDQLQALQPEIRESAQQCRATASPSP